MLLQQFQTYHQFYQEKFVSDGAEYIGKNPYVQYNNAYLKGLI